MRKLKKRVGQSIGSNVFSKTWYKKPFIILKMIRGLVFAILDRDYRYYLEKEIEESKKYSYENSEYVSMQGAGWCEKGKLKKTVFVNTELRRFGGIEVYCISDYDNHLRRLYGEYMTPPPVEKRVAIHNYKLFVEKNTLEEIKDEKYNHWLYNRSI